MYFIITAIFLVLGVIALRKRKDLIGYALLVIGWVVTVVADIVYGQNWDRGFLPAFIGIIFIWYTQRKIEESRQK